PCKPDGSALLALVRILPDEVTNAAKEGDHQKNRADSGEYHCIDEHGCLLLRLPVWDGFTLTATARDKLIWINPARLQGARAGAILTQVKGMAGARPAQAV